MTFIDFIDYAGVFVFAATGALAASRCRLDIIGFIFLANMTAVGGGALRDLMLGNTPVNWVREPLYLLIGTSAAVLVYFTAHRVESRYRILLWLDAIGMAMFSVMGAEKALHLGFNAWVAIVAGIFTATMGGVLRDVVAGQPSVLMRREIYISAALAGACTFVALSALNAPITFSVLAGTGIAFLIRGGALYHGWVLPAHKARRGRTEEELKRDGIVRDE